MHFTVVMAPVVYRRCMSHACETATVSFLLATLGNKIRGAREEHSCELIPVFRQHFRHTKTQLPSPLMPLLLLSAFKLLQLFVGGVQHGCVSSNKGQKERK